jgi:hypothetical protein
MGQSRWSALYGYRLNEKGEAVIGPNEGEIVRSIFNLYREGTPLPAIVVKLNALDIPSPRNCKWTETTVQGILKNERYAGDMILQKWVSVDFKTHECIRNDGKESPDLQARDNHVPIIDRRSFDKCSASWSLKRREVRSPDIRMWIARSFAPTAVSTWFRDRCMCKRRKRQCAALVTMAAMAFP